MKKLFLSMLLLSLTIAGCSSDDTSVNNDKEEVEEEKATTEELDFDTVVDNSKADDGTDLQFEQLNSIDADGIEIDSTTFLEIDFDSKVGIGYIDVFSTEQDIYVDYANHKMYMENAGELVESDYTNPLMLTDSGTETLATTAETFEDDKYKVSGDSSDGNFTFTFDDIEQSDSLSLYRTIIEDSMATGFAQSGMGDVVTDFSNTSAEVIMHVEDGVFTEIEITFNDIEISVDSASLIMSFTWTYSTIDDIELELPDTV